MTAGDLKEVALKKVLQNLGPRIIHVAHDLGVGRIHAIPRADATANWPHDPAFLEKTPEHERSQLEGLTKSRVRDAAAPVS